MNLFVFLLLFICFLHESVCWRFFHQGRKHGGNLGAPSEYDESSNHSVRTEWFEQSLDHFSPGDTRTWKQRYYVNDEFYDGNQKGPVFLMIGGEGEATIKWMTNGTWINYAQRFKALCFQLEHRYYGKSHPTPDLSTKNLQYLTSQQALVDLATFVSSMNEMYNMSSDVKWIAFGGSYPGSLAAWFRSKYPHLVHGAMSASGPLLAKSDFFEYFQVVDDALRTHSDKCVDAIKKGTEQIGVLLRHMVSQRNLNQMFSLCDPIEKSVSNRNDIANFYESLSGNFAGIVQYNKDNRITDKPNNITLNTLCDIMVNENIGLPVARLAAVNSLILNSTNQTCLDYKYDKMIKNMANVSWDAEMSEGGRQWMYQVCTEFGFFQTSTASPQVFGDSFPVEFFVKQCGDIFGPKYNAEFLEKATRRTNIIYGALDISVSNVVFVHGSIDPWHALGITKTVDQNAPAIYIEGTAHCANMYPERDEDLPQLKAAREEIAEHIDSWLRL